MVPELIMNCVWVRERGELIRNLGWLCDNDTSNETSESGPSLIWTKAKTNIIAMKIIAQKQLYKLERKRKKKIPKTEKRMAHHALRHSGVVRLVGFKTWRPKW